VLHVDGGIVLPRFVVLFGDVQHRRDVRMTEPRSPLPARSVSPAPPGKILAGKYRVESVLGSGAMGTVVAATHVHLGQRVALKFMHPSLSADRDAVARFLQEARAAARIRSDHVARVSDIGTLDDGTPYLVMDYLEGRDLSAVLQATLQLSIGEAISYVLEACEGLAEAHAVGIVHRDLKPANLFLTRRKDGTPYIVLLDFGISKLVAAGELADGRITGTQSIVGSPMYMAPEQVRSSRNVDFRADIWSIGVILYEMICGRVPFDGDVLADICVSILRDAPPPLDGFRPDVPEGVSAVVLRCLEKNPARRFRDVAELAEALAPFAGADAGASSARIERLLGPPRTNIATVDTLPRGESVRPLTIGGSTQTSAATETLPHGWPPRRSAVLPFALTAAALVVGAIIAVTRFGGTPENSRSSASVVRPSNSVDVPRSARATEGVPSASTVVPQGPTVVPVEPSAPRIAPVPAPSVAARARRPAKPKAAPVTAAKTSAISAFGGRD
jgi:serine/threonine-protein kinase